MRHKNILIGTRFGNLIVVSFAGIGKLSHAEWNCICDCGKEAIATGHALRKGRKRSCGHLFTTAGVRAHNFKDLTGKSFGKWFVLGPHEIRKLENGKKATFWLCRCACGLQKFVRSAQMVFGVSTGCKKCGARRLPLGASARNTVLNAYKKEAEERNLVWALLDEQFDFITKQNCSYCAAPPSNVRNLGYNNGDFIYNGIDRVDNSRGYEMDNVVPCCRICNRSKDVRTREEFLAWAERIVNHSRKHNDLG